MNELLDHPAIQAGVAPFLAALAVAWPLSRTRFLGLATGAAFTLAVALTIGFSFTASTSLQKLITIEMLLIALIVPLELLAARIAPGRLRMGLAGAAGLSAIWVAWRVLQQQELATALLAGAAAALFVAALAYTAVASEEDAAPASASALVLGLGSGALALAGASALLAQLGIATAAGAGAAWLVLALKPKSAPTGHTLALPAHVAAGLVGTLAVATGSLPWYGLLPMLAVPACARIKTMPGRAFWLRSFVATATASIPMLLAVFISLWTARAS
ncbi:hypothetical protein [Variovorax terrae]|uniref:Uncharacterized protein n=1 Tax=Variovorax terrae TaxID=2923278 RepID=A0A9X1VXH0_9BURK|nr:hypothetical protein [Variovorax terrae]MCJ0765207.1 hypothetical protein [Variovorax terrae]